ncbi:MAG: hypothetical protein ACR2PT_06930, partial [Endozoicomonas sp.]
LMLPDYQNPVKAGPLAFLSGSGMPALPPTELYMAPTLAQRMSLESLMHSCPTGGGRNAKKPSAKKGASAATGQAESGSHHRTVQEICVDYINDAEADYWNTIHNKDWLYSAFKPFIERFTPGESGERTPENIAVQFIEDLTRYTLDQLNSCEKELPNYTFRFKDEKLKRSLLVLIAGIQRASGGISKSAGGTQFNREIARFPGKYQFQIYSFLSSNTLIWLQKLIDLLCLTYDESYPGGEGEDGITTLLEGLGLIYPLASSGAKGGQTLHVAAPWRVNRLEKVIAPVDLLRAMRDFYSDKPRVHKGFERISGLDGATPSDLTDQFHSLSVGEGVAAGGATASGPFIPEAGPPLSSGPTHLRPKTKRINELKRAIKSGKVEEAKQIYSAHKATLESDTKWKTVKRDFRDLLRKKGEIAFLQQNDLG